MRQRTGLPVSHKVDINIARRYLESRSIYQYPTTMNFDFSPEKSLFSLPIVRWCAGVSFGIAATIFIVIMFHFKDYPFDFSGQGFNNFAEFYKVPAAFLAIGLTLVGICAANHRSEQTKKQIEKTTTQIGLTNSQIDLTKIQNNFSNYYKHIEEFEKYCGDHTEFKTITIQPRKLHRLLFPNSNSASAIFEINNDFIAKFDTFTEEFLNFSSKFSDLPNDLKYFDANDANERIELFKRFSFISITSSGGGTEIESRKRKFILPNGSWPDFIKNFIYIISIIDTVLKFDLNYNSSEVIKSALSIDLNSIPRSGSTAGLFSIEEPQVIA